MEEIKKSGLTLQEAQDLVDLSIQDVKNGFVATGYYLWMIREERLWEEDGYNSFPEFLHCQYQKDKSWASRCISLYEKFGKQVEFGELPVLAVPYREYSVSQLIEMVSMTEEQRGQVTPDMKVREIREMKPKREKKAAAPPGEEAPAETAGGQPEGRLPGQMEPARFIGGSCDVATGEGQETSQGIQEPPEVAKMAGSAPDPEKWQETAQAAPEGAKELDGDVGTGSCAYREGFPCSLTRGQQKTVGGNGNCHTACCWECASREGCKLECNSSASREDTAVAEEEPLSVQAIPPKADSMQVHSEREEEGGDPEPKEIKTYDRKILEQMISEEEQFLDAMGEYWKKDLPECYTQGAMKIQAYKNLMAEHDAAEAAGPGLAENPDLSQPDLPNFKNDDQRKAWIEDYKAWGLWYRDGHIDVNYYKFDFPNGSRLVAVEYPQRESIWNSSPYDDVIYHLIEKNKQKYGCMATYDDKFHYHSSSVTELVGYLKKIQEKGGKG